jgi:hypothetical protein
VLLVYLERHAVTAVDALLADRAVLVGGMVVAGAGTGVDGRGAGAVCRPTRTLLGVAAPGTELEDALEEGPGQGQVRRDERGG